MRLILGDCLEKLKDLPDNSVDSIVTDPPYGIGFMNKEWDSPEKLRQQQERDLERTKIRKENGTAPVTASFSPFPGQGWKGAKEGKWFQEWCEEWGRECLRVLKPGGHMLSFSAPRMYHRMTTGLEDAGFEIRDQLMWVFGSGFPKSHNIGKAMDKLMGNEREVVGTSDKKSFESWADFTEREFERKDNNITKGQSEWEGWGTALKPAHEPIVVARKPLSEKSVAENVLKWGTGGMNIDVSRVPFEDTPNAATNPLYRQQNDYKMPEKGQESNGSVSFTSSNNDISTLGRFPANIILDEEAGQILDEQSGISKSTPDKRTTKTPTGQIFGTGKITSHNDKGGASRFFYCPKTSKKDRDEGLDGFEEKGKGWSNYLPPTTNGTSDVMYDRNTTIKNNHPTVKPTSLMEYLIKLVTPVNGTVLDPFMGSGSTGKASVRGGFDFIGIEKEEEYIKIAEARINNEYKSKSD